MKSHYRLDELPTRKAHIVEILLLGVAITLLVSRWLLQTVRERLRLAPYKMPEQRWADIFAAAAPAILDIVLLPPRVSKVIAQRLESMLLHEAPDANPSRQLLIERVKSCAAWAQLYENQFFNRSRMPSGPTHSVLNQPPQVHEVRRPALYVSCSQFLHNLPCLLIPRQLLAARIFHLESTRI